jgi:hypothetical protein
MLLQKMLFSELKKGWIKVLDTSGILPSKLQNSLIWQDHFSENYFPSSQKTRFYMCAVPFPSVFRSKFTVSQNNSFSRQFEDFNDYELQKL